MVNVIIAKCNIVYGILFNFFCLVVRMHPNLVFLWYN